MWEGRGGMWQRCLSVCVMEEGEMKQPAESEAASLQQPDYRFASKCCTDCRHRSAVVGGSSATLHIGHRNRILAGDGDAFNTIWNLLHYSVSPELGSRTSDLTDWNGNLWWKIINLQQQYAQSCKIRVCVCFFFFSEMKVTSVSWINW